MKDEQIITLESRLQDVTESKDIIQKELEETNCWYNNQQQLIKDLEVANQVNTVLTEEKELVEQQVRVHEVLQKKLMELHGKGKCQKLTTKDATSQPERMTITNAVVTKFFRKQEPAESL